MDTGGLAYSIWYLKVACILLICLAGSGSLVSAYHIPTVDEGLLSDRGCYIGAYLGGNQGSNNVACVNYYQKAQPNPWETQIWDHPGTYGERASDGVAAVDTGIDTFRTSVESIHPGSGNKQLLFSRYYNLASYPDSDYGKIKYTPSSSCIAWAEHVLQQGGIPVIVLYPWSYTASDGTLDLSVTAGGSKSGTQKLSDIAGLCDALSKKYPDKSGKAATILICFGLEYNAQWVVNPSGNDSIDDANKKAWRKAFRTAYSVFHAQANPSVQMIWAGNIAQKKEDRLYYWPGTGDNGEQLSKDSVDWVGMTWYPWPGGPTSLTQLKGFYDYYSVEKKHPFIFMETSADGQGSAEKEKQYKENQVTYLYNATTLSAFPNIKGIIWFDVIKGEAKSGSDGTMVAKNFLIPDGDWDNHDKSISIPGTLYSLSNRTRMMSNLYPDAAADSYFLGKSGNLVVADYSTRFGRNAFSIQLVDTSKGQVTAWKWDVNNDTIPEYETKNATHTFDMYGKYPINLTIKAGDEEQTEMRVIRIPGGLISDKPFISFGTNPDNGFLFIDNTFYGRTNGNEKFFQVPPGTHTIRIVRDGYRPWSARYSLQWPEMKSYGIINLTRNPETK